MSRGGDYCFSCKKDVTAAKGRCPGCDKVLWTAMATEPHDYKHKLRTTGYSIDTLLRPREFEEVKPAERDSTKEMEFE